MSDKNIILLVNKEELQAISDSLHGRHHIRFNPDEKWTAVKKLELLAHVDAELVLANAVPFIMIEPKKTHCAHGVSLMKPCIKCIQDRKNP